MRTGSDEYAELGGFLPSKGRGKETRIKTDPLIGKKGRHKVEKDALLR